MRAPADAGRRAAQIQSDLSDTWKKCGMARLIGDPVTDAAKFKATSPSEHADKIHAPVLLAYGGKDKRVPIEHGERFHDALMKQPGAASEWIVTRTKATAGSTKRTTSTSGTGSRSSATPTSARIETSDGAGTLASLRNPGAVRDGRLQ